jgi:hypothetical protein
VSKRKGQRKKRRKKASQARKTTRAGLLGALADALNACETAGMRVRFRHGAAFCHDGAVIPPEKKGGRWAARPFRPGPLSPGEPPDDLDD